MTLPLTKVFARGFCGTNAYVKGYATRITAAASHTAGSRRIYNVCRQHYLSYQLVAFMSTK